jgi:hypothetical protein
MFNELTALTNCAAEAEMCSRLERAKVPRKVATNKKPSSDPKRVVAAFLEEAGEVRRIDVARYGQRAGQIIARSAQPRRQFGRRRH